MENKSEMSKNIIIIVLVIMIIGLAGLMCYDKFVVNKEPEKTKTTEKKEETKVEETKKETIIYSIDDPKISGLIDKLIVDDDDCNTIEEFTNNKKIEAKDISNLRAYNIAKFNELMKKNNNTFSLDEMNKAIWKYLGAEYKYDPTSFNHGNDCSGYKYNSKTKTYTKNGITGCGNVCGPHTLYKIVKAVEEDELKLDIKVIFAKDAFYSDYEKTNKIGEFEDNLASLYEKGSTYQFTFKLTDGNYVFVSSEKI